mmetsp:Transcript_75997/g.222774  ORF Transcript_75997/g.222774 Transcript_75997/m.222774 type:complete len:257 (-) Transcript_75997:1302-2072(-)
MSWMRQGAAPWTLCTACWPCGLLHHSSSWGEPSCATASAPWSTSSSALPSRSSEAASARLLVQRPGHTASAASMTSRVHARRERSGPTTASTRGFCSHCSRLPWPLLGSCSSEAGSSSSLPSKSQAIFTLPLPLSASVTTALYHEPSYLALTFAPTLSVSAAFVLVSPPFARALTVVPRGSQKAKQPLVSSMRLSAARSVPATAETAAVGTRTREAHSSSSSGTSDASPKGPPWGTICVSSVCARLRSSPSPAMSA